MLSPASSLVVSLCQLQSLAIFTRISSVAFHVLFAAASSASRCLTLSS